MTTVTRVQQSPPRPAQRWWARLAFVLVVAAIVVLLVAAGLKSIVMVVVGVGGLALAVMFAWKYVTGRGASRAVFATLAVAAPLVVIGIYISAGLLWLVVVTLVLGGLGAVAGRNALVSGESTRVAEFEVPPPARPFVIMNPRSGGGKVQKFDLERKAVDRGAEVVLLEGSTHVDVSQLARDAVARGADLLGVAGGDGTQALVAEVAAEFDVPLMVISAGTRNHFALDLGLDREDPSRCLDALTDGVELHIDLGHIADRPFVNNASFGAYAEIVQDPAYRDDKVHTTLEKLPDMLLGQKGAQLRVSIDGGQPLVGPQAVLVSNNPYEMGDIAGLGRRARIDTGVLGVVIVKVGTAAQAAGLLRRKRAQGLTFAVAQEVLVDADAAQVPVGIDGEAIVLPTPVRCTVRPSALRVRVPRDRPGVPALRPALDWPRLRHLAFGTSRPAAGNGQPREPVGG